jgi:hypothetical protein
MGDEFRRNGFTYTSSGHDSRSDEDEDSLDDERSFVIETLYGDSTGNVANKLH